MTQNWRPETDAATYFGHHKKRAEIEQRRPTARRAVDLVGPGIGATAVPVANWNDRLAMFNGYYSSLPGAANAPNAIESFIGHVINDADLGGQQVVTGLASRAQYRRTFLRNPSDPNSILWDPTWTPILTYELVRAQFIAQYRKPAYAMDPPLSFFATPLSTVETWMGTVYLGGSVSASQTMPVKTQNPTYYTLGSMAEVDAPPSTLQFPCNLSGGGADGATGMLTITATGEVRVTPSTQFTTVRLTGAWPNKTMKPA